MKRYIFDLMSKADRVIHEGEIDCFLNDSDKYCLIDKVENDKTRDLRNTVDKICSLESRSELLILHFIGHGNADLGMEFLTWEEIGDELLKIRSRINANIYINMLGVCGSVGFLPYANCCNKLWYTSSNAESLLIPFDIYKEPYFSKFDLFLREFDANGYFGFKIHESELPI